MGKILSDGYFLLSNNQINANGKTYNRLAIKLLDELLLTGNGCMIYYGTMPSTIDGCIFGYHIAANGISMSCKMEKKSN